MAQWLFTDEQTVSMPINTLAIEILRSFAPNGWNQHSWIAEVRQSGSLRSPAAQRAASEAWAWLDSRGLVAWDPDQPSADSRFVTRLGHEALTSGIARIDAAARLGMQLHPRIAKSVEQQFLLGEFELAVFAAFKDVEVRVRDLSSLGADLVGTALMQRAFAPDGGPLADAKAEGGERVARMELFKGAIGSFKNPSSHRDVDFDDPTEAAEIILLADLLHRILDRIAVAAT